MRSDDVKRTMVRPLGADSSNCVLCPRILFRILSSRPRQETRERLGSPHSTMRAIGQSAQKMGVDGNIGLSYRYLMLSIARKLFKRLRGPSSRLEEYEHHRKINLYGDKFMSIPELEIFGQYKRSHNGRYLLIWQNSIISEEGDRAQGRYILLDEGQVVVDGLMDRPHHGKVGNDGTFILNDWGSPNELAGTFVAFSSDGREVVSRLYSANLLNNGISHSGAMAVCQTCNAPGSIDSSILEIFDLKAGKSVARWTAESGWADDYEFPSEGNTIRMIRRNKPALNYTLFGDFLDRDLWLRDEIARGNVFVIERALKEGEEINGIGLDTLAAGARTAISSDDIRFHAKAWRLLGEIEERENNFAAALRAFDNALAINPKIGIAKRAAKLRRSVAN